MLRGDGTFGSGGSGAVGWLLNGNSGTDPSTQFIGTTDDQPLLFRVKNQPSGIIDSANGNTALGFKAFASNAGGFSNTATGFSALHSNTIGRANTANGASALYSNTTGLETQLPDYLPFIPIRRELQYRQWKWCT